MVIGMCRDRTGSGRVLRTALALGLLGANCGGAEDGRVTVRAAPVSVANEPFDEAVEPEESLDFRYHILDEESTGQLRLMLVRNVPLGLDSTAVPVEPLDLHVEDGTFYLLDGQARRIVAYDTSGHVVFTAGSWGTGPGQLDGPVQLGADGDTLLVLDLSHPNHVMKFDRRGTYLGARTLRLDEGGASMAVSADGGTLYVATLVARPRGTERYAMLALDRSGTVLWRGCQSDPRYIASDSAHGMIGAFAFRTVAKQGGLLFCAQPITPIVQMFDTSGHYRGALRRAPHFYRPPVDEMHEAQGIPRTKDVLRFQAKWTKHSRFFPLEHGYLSIYSSYDTLSMRSEFHLFACDSSSDSSAVTRCAAAESPGRPVGVTGNDTVWVVAEDSAVAGGAALRGYRFLVPR